jgi:hypothetical protein
VRKPANKWTVLGAIGLVAIAILVLRCRTKAGLHTQAGHPHDDFVVGSGNDAKIVLVDRVSNFNSMYWGFRVAVIDMTGTLLAERVFDDAVKCEPATGAGIWCVMSDHGTPPRILFAIPELTEVPDSVIAGREKGQKPWCKTTDSLSLGTERLGFGDGPRYPLVRRPAELERVGPAPITPPAEATTFLRKDGKPDFVDLADPALILILHDSSLDPNPIAQISRVDEHLQRRWTADLGTELIYRCTSATLSGRKLVISTRDANSRIVAIDVDSGKVLWRFAFD